MLKSFIPSGIKLWNNLEPNLRSTQDINTFRLHIKQNILPDEFYKPFLSGCSRDYTHLSRLRMGLSGLNAHRKHYHFIDHSSCPNCHYKIEDTVHYLLRCPSYAAQRAEMLADLTQFIPDLPVLAHSNSRNSLIK